MTTLAPHRSPRTPLRTLAAVCAIVVGLTALGCGVHSHRDYDDDPEVHVTVHNLFGEDIYVEARNSYGGFVDLGTIDYGDAVTFGLDDRFYGGELYARCACDGHLIEMADIDFDGQHFTVD